MLRPSVASRAAAILALAPLPLVHADATLMQTLASNFLQFLKADSVESKNSVDAYILQLITVIPGSQ